MSTPHWGLRLCLGLGLVALGFWGGWRFREVSSGPAPESVRGQAEAQGQVQRTVTRTETVDARGKPRVVERTVERVQVQAREAQPQVMEPPSWSAAAWAKSDGKRFGVTGGRRLVGPVWAEVGVQADKSGGTPDLTLGIRVEF